MDVVIAGETFLSSDKSAVLSRTTGNEVYIKRTVFTHQGRILGTERTGRRAWQGTEWGNGRVIDSETAAFAHINEAQRWVSTLRKQLDVERAQVRLRKDEAC